MPETFDHGASHAQTTLAARAVPLRHGTPERVATDVVFPEAAGFQDQAQREKKRDVGAGKERDRRLKVIENDEKNTDENGEHGVPESQAERSFAEIVHGVVSVTPGPPLFLTAPSGPRRADNVQSLIRFAAAASQSVGHDLLHA